MVFPPFLGALLQKWFSSSRSIFSHVFPSFDKLIFQPFPAVGEALGRQSLPHDGGQRTVGPGAARKEPHHWWLQDASRQKHHVQSDLGSWSIWSPNIPKYPQMTLIYFAGDWYYNIDPYWKHVNHGLVTTRWVMCRFWWISLGGARAADQRCSSAQPSLI